jgi:hypothetical protein
MPNINQIKFTKFPKIHKNPKIPKKFKIIFEISHTPQRLYMDQINSNKYREF